MLSEMPKDVEFFEAVISAMRSLLQMIASKNIAQVQNTFKTLVASLVNLTVSSQKKKMFFDCRNVLLFHKDLT